MRAIVFLAKSLAATMARAAALLTFAYAVGGFMLIPPTALFQALPW